MSSLRKKAIEGIIRGQTVTVSRTFTGEDIQRFADISRDYNPVHFDERFAQEKGYDGCICHGLLVAALITEIGGQLGWLASKMSFSFIKPVYLGDSIRCDFTITDIDDRGRARGYAKYCDQKGSMVLEAELYGILPDDAEKKILRTMLAEGDPTNALRDD